MLSTKLTAIVLSLAAAAGCSGSAPVAAQAPPRPPGAPAARAAQPTPDELASLARMRAEEKLARDVYATLAHRGVPFDHIGAAEVRHEAAVVGLLAQFGAPDPAAGAAAGVFGDPALQALYAELVARSAKSPLDALRVGLEIEERDLADLARERALVRHPDIAFVFDQLARGSRNHLRAFHRALTAAGGSYTPRHLDPARYTEIANAAPEPGPGMRGGMRPGYGMGGMRPGYGMGGMHAHGMGAAHAHGMGAGPAMAAMCADHAAHAAAAGAAMPGMCAAHAAAAGHTMPGMGAGHGPHAAGPGHGAHAMPGVRPGATMPPCMAAPTGAAPAAAPSGSAPGG